MNSPHYEYDIMTDDEFRSSLEFRIGRELTVLSGKPLRHMWRDRVFGSYIGEENGRRPIMGTSFLGNNGQTEMQLVMFLPEDAYHDRMIDQQERGAFSRPGM
jgi:hypothetical protein